MTNDPRSEERTSSGVEVVVNKIWQHLPSTGMTPVPKDQIGDIIATHVFSKDIVDVLHLHGLYPTASKSESEPWMWELNKRVIESVKTSRIITVPSLWVGELFARDMGFWPVVIPHGLDVEEWPEPDYAVKSNILWNKNRDTDVCHVEPMNMLAAIMPDMHFTSTFGKATENVQVTGQISHAKMKALIYSTGGIYYASTKETFGIATLEAMAAGMPVLGWNWGSTPCLVQHEVTGYLADPGNIEHTKLGVEYILDNYDRLSRAARQAALQYDWKEVIKLYAAVYQDAYDESLTDAQPLVTVIIPCYNYHRFVVDAINSVKAQTYSNWECIVVDDGSTDGSPEVILAAIEGDSRFRLLQQRNNGVATARNHGAREAKGRFVLFLDADDYLITSALKRLVAPLSKDRGLGVAYGNLVIVKEDGSVQSSKNAWPGTFNFAQQLAGKNQAPSCCMIRKEAFFRAGGYRQHTWPAEDAELWTRIPLVGYRIEKVTDEALYNYRLHRAAATSEIREGRKKEPDWLQYIAVHNGAPQPFGSLVPPENGKSHPVGVYDEPPISVIIPCGNAHGALLRDAIESVMAQSDIHWEIIVVDDTDTGDLGTRGYYPYSVQYPFVRWLRNEKLHNVSAARNAGAAASRGRYLVFLDADDYMLPDFLKATYAIQKECQGDGSLVYTDWISAPKMEPHQAENWNLERLMSHALFAVTFMHTKAMWKEVGGFSEDVDLWEDWDYTLKLAMAGAKGIRVPRQLFVYRYNTGNRRNESLANKEELLQKIRGKFSLIIPKKRKG